MANVQWGSHLCHNADSSGIRILEGVEGKRAGKFTIDRNHCDMMNILLGPKLQEWHVFPSEGRRWRGGGFTINTDQMCHSHRMCACLSFCCKGLY